jgi:phage tail-like protein
MRDVNGSLFALLADPGDWTNASGMQWTGAAYTLEGQQAWRLPNQTRAAARTALGASQPTVVDPYGGVASITADGMSIQSPDGSGSVPIRDLNGTPLAPKTGKFVGMALGAGRLALLASEGTNSFLQMFDLRGRRGLDTPENPAVPLTLDSAGSGVAVAADGKIYVLVAGGIGVFEGGPIFEFVSFTHATFAPITANPNPLRRTALITNRPAGAPVAIAVDATRIAVLLDQGNAPQTLAICDRASGAWTAAPVTATDSTVLPYMTDVALLDEGRIGLMAPATNGAIGSIAWSSGTATVTTSAPHGLTVHSAQYLSIEGTVPAGYNGTFLCTIIGESTFTYSLGSNPGSVTTGGIFVTGNPIDCAVVTLASAPLQGVAMAPYRYPMLSQAAPRFAAIPGPHAQYLAQTGPRRLLPLPYPAYLTAGALCRCGIAGNDPDGVWHRLYAEAHLPPGTSIKVWARAAEEPLLVGDAPAMLATIQYASLGASVDNTGLLYDAPSSGAISSIAWSSNTAMVTTAAGSGTATVTTTTPHGLTVRSTHYLSIANTAPAGYNGSFLCTVTGDSTFTYSLASNPGSVTTEGIFIIGVMIERIDAATAAAIATAYPGRVPAPTPTLTACLNTAPFHLQPPPALSDLGSELPFHPGLAALVGAPGALYELLLQRTGGANRRLTGAFLDLVMVASGDGRHSPCLRAVRVYTPRFSYQDEYLPALFRQTAISDESDQSNPASPPDFRERLLAAFEGMLTPIEDRVARAEYLLDPYAAPADTLPWLASYLGRMLDPGWPEARQRRAIAQAGRQLRDRGTYRGVCLALDIATDGAVARGEVVVLETHRLRRTNATVLGLSLSGLNPLTAYGVPSGNSIVGDTLVLSAERAVDVMALLAPSAVQGADAATVAQFLDEYADRVQVTTLLQGPRAASYRAVVDTVLQAELPAQLAYDIIVTDQRFILGLSPLLDVDTFLDPAPAPAELTLNQSVMGRDAVLRDPPALQQ